MTTVLSQKGQVVLPDAVRQRMHLHAGDDFEVSMEDENTITLRRITQPLSKRPRLDDLLAQVTLENLHPATEGK
jgi:AbrB family looped-hinge helix DNA binding protein